MKKLLTKLAICGLAIGTALSFAACGAGGPGGWDGWGDWSNGGSMAPEGGTPDYDASEDGRPENPDEESGGNYVYGSIVEQGFKNVAKEPSSYFSLDRNTASYSQVRM